jgi:site-specific DNA-methyltransferase (adenine-specific)
VRSFIHSGTGRTVELPQGLRRWESGVFMLNQIHLGDCCELMRALPSESVDFVLTDPPYLVGYEDRSGRTLAGDKKGDWLKPAFAQMFRVLKPHSLCVSFYGWSKTDEFYAAWKAAGFRVVGHITFPKRYTSSTRLMRYQHENAYLLAKGNPQQPAHVIGDVVDWTYSGNKLHPTQKPLQVLTPLIESFCPRRGVVLDPFAGSASTLVAAHAAGRQYVGMEIEAHMHQIATQRLEACDRRLAWSLGTTHQAANSSTQPAALAA